MSMTLSQELMMMPAFSDIQGGGGLNNCGCPMNWQWNIGIFVYLVHEAPLFTYTGVDFAGQLNIMGANRVLIRQGVFLLIHLMKSPCHTAGV